MKTNLRNRLLSMTLAIAMIFSMGVFGAINVSAAGVSDIINLYKITPGIDGDIDTGTWTWGTTDATTFTTAGITGVTATNLTAVKTAIEIAHPDVAAGADASAVAPTWTLTQLQAIINALFDATLVPSTKDAEKTIVKGEKVLDIGTAFDLGTGDNAGKLPATITAGTVTVPYLKSIDTTNLTNYITAFVPTNNSATVTPYLIPAGVATSRLTVNADTSVVIAALADSAVAAGETILKAAAYTTAALNDGDYFIVEVTAEDATTVKYYKIDVTVSYSTEETFIINYELIKSLSAATGTIAENDALSITALATAINDALTAFKALSKDEKRLEAIGKTSDEGGSYTTVPLMQAFLDGLKAKADVIAATNNLEANFPAVIYVGDNVIKMAEKLAGTGFKVTIASVTATVITPVDIMDATDVTKKLADAGAALTKGLSDVTFTVAKDIGTAASPAIYSYVASAANNIAVATVMDYSPRNADEVNVIGVPSKTLEGATGDFKIDLVAEKLTVPTMTDPNDATKTVDAYKILFYSIDGGTKWKEAKDTFTNAAKFAKLFGKDIELWVSDKALGDDKQPVTSDEDATKNANIVKFAKINKRPKLDKLVVNYAIEADSTGATAGYWVLAAKDATTATKISVDVPGAPIEVALADATKKNPDANGFGRFFITANEAAGEYAGIPVKMLTGAKPEKTVYLVRTGAFKGTDGSYTAASKVKKYSVVSEQVAPKYSVKKGIVKVKAATRIATVNNGIISTSTTLMESKGDYSTAGSVVMWTAATPKKPASAKTAILVVTGSAS